MRKMKQNTISTSCKIAEQCTTEQPFVIVFLQGVLIDSIKMKVPVCVCLSWTKEGSFKDTLPCVNTKAASTSLEVAYRKGQN